MNEVKRPRKPLIYYYGIILLILLLFNLLALPRITQRQVVEVDYGTFMSMTESGEVGRAEIQEQENRILFTNKEETTVYKTAMVEDPDLTERLHEAGVPFYGQEIQQESPILSFLLTWILPLVVFIAIGQFMSKKLMDRAGGANAMSFGFGKSNAKIYVKSSEGIKFSDVAGEDEAKESLAEIVDYLHDPSKYREIGASPEQLKELIFEGSATKRILRHYQEIGTVEECREAVGKQKPKNIEKIREGEYCCPKCYTVYDDCIFEYDYCINCGQAIRWNENLEGMEDE